MTTTARWRDFMANDGAQTTTERARAALLAAAEGAVLCDLSHYGLIAFEGPDAEAFLHGQLSSDVRALARDRCQLAAYNTPKGRVLGILLLWRIDGGLLAQCPGVLAEPLRRRLSMFILRSKLRASAADDRYVSIGIGGPGAGALLRILGLGPPDGDFGLLRDLTLHAGADWRVDCLLRLPGGRYVALCADVGAATTLWSALRARGAVVAGPNVWSWLGVRSGIPEVLPPTQEQFIPQMLNLERLGAVSFSKGCYPGQEIVARTQYLGEIKRRLYRLHADQQNPPEPATPVYAPMLGEQAAGMVVNAAAAPDNGCALLACLRADAASAGADLRLASPNGPRLTLLDSAVSP